MVSRHEEEMGQDPTSRAKQMKWGLEAAWGRIHREAVWGAESARAVSTQHSYNGYRDQARPSRNYRTHFFLLPNCPSLDLGAGRAQPRLQHSTLYTAGPRARSLLGCRKPLIVFTSREVKTRIRNAGEP